MGGLVGIVSTYTHEADTMRLPQGHRLKRNGLYGVKTYCLYLPTHPPWLPTAFWKVLEGTVVVRTTRLIINACACTGPPYVRHGYIWVPVQSDVGENDDFYAFMKIWV